MCKGVDKSGQSCGSKLKMENKDRGLFKRRFYMGIGIMCWAHSGQPGVISGTFERCGITRRGGF
jgi:hypothetical protein